MVKFYKSTAKSPLQVSSSPAITVCLSIGGHHVLYLSSSHNHLSCVWENVINY